MIKIFLLIICSTIFSQNIFSDFSIAVELLQVTKNEEIKLKVEVKNLSDKAATIFKNRRQDYKREKINALGNYVIEVQKFEKNQYNLFTPSADIDPAFENQEYISLQKDHSIIDTLYINGFSFSISGEHKRGFPSGRYRLRIFFNPDMWNCNETNSSNWIEFKIE